MLSPMVSRGRYGRLAAAALEAERLVALRRLQRAELPRCPVCGKQGRLPGRIVWCECSGWVV